jgi:hypothetical protein
MRAEYEYGTVRHIADSFHEYSAAAAQLLNYVGVVNDFVVDINGRAVGFQRQLYDIDGADDPGTKSTGTNAK